MHEDIAVLRDFRDAYLMPNSAGRTFVKIYSVYLEEISRMSENGG